MRIFLVQPDDALAASMTTEMEELGMTPVRITSDDADLLRDLTREKPQAVLICLDSQPDAAIDLAEKLSARRRMRGIALVFAGGTQAALTAAEASFPRANFSRRDVVYNVLASLRS